MREENYLSYFDKKTGFYMRTGVLDDEGNETGKDVFMASYPELIDVGIMGHCIHGSNGLCIKSGVQCYQSGLKVQKPNMTLEDFRKIAEESRGRSYQFALGGRGDPDMHENFKEILKCCVENEIVPNFTTSGLGMTEEKAKLCKEFCGAVAISEYRQEHTYKAIDMLLKVGVTTNIHYVLGNNSIDEAIRRLNNNDFPKGINAIIFLLHKPIGQGRMENVLNVEDERVQEFFKVISEKRFDFQIGFDSCTVPGLINYSKGIAEESIDTCEGARWSMYISADMIAYPCSFDQKGRWAYNIKNSTIENAWKSEQFEDFRSHFENSCKGCKDRERCMGGCPISRDVVLCKRVDRNLYK